MLLELKGVKKYFSVAKGFLSGSSSFVKAVDGVDLTIKEGESLGLVGESGSGKSTLAKLILKLYPVDSGTVFFQDKNITQLRGGGIKEYRRNMQMVFQDPFSSLDPRFSIRRIMHEAFTLIPGTYTKVHQKEERIIDLFKSVHLKADVLNRYPHEFSGGERQRIAIARALILNPKLLILDEAVSSLDVIIQKEIIDLLKELQKQFSLTYLFITHNLKVVRRLSQRVGVMYRGKLVELAATDEIFDHPLHDYTKELLSASINYQAFYRERPIELDEKSRLTDRGQGHFVMI